MPWPVVDVLAWPAVVVASWVALAPPALVTGAALLTGADTFGAGVGAVEVFFWGLAALHPKINSTSNAVGCLREKVLRAFEELAQNGRGVGRTTQRADFLSCLAARNRALCASNVFTKSSKY
jgi:hypothetical protein